MTGALNFVLHAHLPYIKHPEDPYHLEQKWFFESVVESYIPLINTFFALAEQSIPFHVTLSLSPTLCIMLADPVMQDSCELHMLKLVELAEHECIRNRKSPSYDLSRAYLKHFRQILRYFTERYGKDLIGALKELHESGHISLITTTATHAFLPILEDYPGAVSAQVRAGLDIFSGISGITPRGIWLPECGYSPEIEAVLKQAGLDFTIIDGHGVVFARPTPSVGIYKPVRGPHELVLFGRDAALSQLIWSAEVGYPADPDYRDFYDDIAYEIPIEIVKKFLHPAGIRMPSGIKYKRITGPGKKEWYSPEKAARKTTLHAAHFAQEVFLMMDRVSGLFKTDPLLTVAFDAELFGHWWYEGCDWLQKMFMNLAKRSVLIAGFESFISDNPVLEKVIPEKSSWGYKGYNETWINSSNDWMIRYIHEATEMMTGLARRYRNTRDQRIINSLDEAAAEVLLLQSSDWSFLMDQGTSESYVRRRFLSHYERALEIGRLIQAGKIPSGGNNAGFFTVIDFRLFSQPELPSSNFSI